MAEVAQAVVAIIPSARGFSKNLNRELGGQVAGVGDRQGRSLGSRMAAGMGRALKVGAKTAAVGAGIAAGAAVIGGFRSAVSQQNAQKVFSGLYGSTEKATAMMKDLRKISSESAISYDTYTKAGQSLAYAGIEGKDAVGILDNVGKAIVAAGGDAPQMESAMGGVMKAVNNGGIAMMDSLSMISEAGVPILSGLGEKFGKSTDQIKKMASDGQITIEDVMDVMQKGTGQTFQQMIKAGESANKSFGNTFKRIKDNAITSIGTGLVPLLDRATPALERFGGWLDKAIPSGMSKLGGAASAVAPVLRDLGGTVLSGINTALEWLAPHLRSFASSMADLAPQAKALASSVGSFLVAAFKAARPYLEAAAKVLGVVLVGAMKALPPILSVAMGALRGILAVIKPLLPLIAAVAAAWVSYRLALLGITAVTKAYKAAALLTRIQLGLLAVQERIAAAATKARALATKVAGAVQSLMSRALIGTRIQLGLLRVQTIAATVAEKARMVMQRAGLAVAKASLVASIAYRRATNFATLSTIRQTVAEKARAFAMKVSTIATKALVLAQRAFNAVLRMNPIGLVITALIALGAGMVLAYKKSETFRRIVDAAWAGIKRAAAATVAWFRNTAWPWMRAAFANIGKAAKWLWQKGIRPAFNGMAKIISWWYRNIVKRYFALVRGAFRMVASVARWLWRKGIAPAFRGIVAVGKWLWARLRGYFNLIGRIWRVAASVARWLWRKGIAPAFQGIARLGSWLWGRLKASFAFIRRGFQGVQRVAMWLWNKGIKPSFGYIAGRAKWLWGRTKWAFDAMKRGMTALRDRFATARDQIGRIWSKLKGKITAPVRSAIRWLQKNFVGKLNKWMGRIPGVPSKGILGRIPGFARGGYTGRGGKYDPAGVVHRDEFVVRSESRRQFEKQNPGALDHLNKTGQLPGYRIGGKVSGLNPRFLKMLHAFNAAAGGRYRVNSGYRSNAHQRQLYARYLAGRGPVAAKPGSSMHNRGLAADLAPSNARDVHGRLARSMGLVFTVPSESWHIEPAWGRGSNAGPGKGGGGGGLSGWLLDVVSNPLGAVKDKIKGLTKNFDPKKFGIVGKVIPAIFNKIKSAVGSKVKDAVSSLNPFGGGGGSVDFGDIKQGTNLAMGKAMARKYGWTGAQWSALKVLWNKESNWNHRARNPSSGAYGIPQSLPASKMRSEGADYLTNPVTQIAWGLKYIKGRYGNPGRALSFHHRNNWYADGGLVRPPVFDNGGTLGPGLNLVHNATGKPEPLVRPEAALSGPVTVNVIDRDGTFVDRMRGEIEADRRQQAVRDRLRR